MSRPAGSPLFIVGAPRSGTSLVYRLLALHPQVSWVSNYVRRAPALPQLAALNRVAGLTPRTRATVWFGSDGDNAYRYGGARSLLDRTYPQPVEGEPLFAHHGVPEAVDPAASLEPTAAQLRLPGSLRTLARWQGGPVVVSKRIGHNRRIPLLHRLSPSARFLDVTRDGRAVAFSLLRVDWWPELEIWWDGGRHPQDLALATGRPPLELAARHWIQETAAIDAGLSVVPDAQVRRIRYEDLVSAPRDVLTGVAGFAGVDPADRRWLAALEHVRFPDKNAAWARTVTPEEGRVLSLLDGRLREKGYPV